MQYTTVYVPTKTIQFAICNILHIYKSSVLLDGWQEGHPACKNWVVGCWCGYVSGSRC